MLFNKKNTAVHCLFMLVHIHNALTNVNKYNLCILVNVEINMN